MPKRRQGEAPAEEPPAKKQNGGAGRGQGRKPKAVNAPGHDSAKMAKVKQASLSDLLGQRTKLAWRSDVSGDRRERPLLSADLAE